MSSKYAQGKHTLAECDRCGFRYKRKTLKELVVNEAPTNLQVCTQCWEEDHPQYKVGKYPVVDPQAIMNPRPDRSLTYTGGDYSSRDFQWGWNPVGGSRGFDDGLTPNVLVLNAYVGTVTVQIT